MEDALFRIAALAPTLKEAELRCLIELAARQQNGIAQTSSRALARATAVSRNHVQAAIHSLTDRSIISSDGGTATKATSYGLNFLATAVLPTSAVPPERGCFREPPLAPQGSLPLAAFGSHPGCEGEPPPGYLKQPHPRARVENSDSIELLDRLLKSSPKKFDDATRAKAKEWLYGYMRKFGRERDPHPPDEQIIAQFLSIAPWAQLENLLMRLFRENCESGKTYAWFVYVALQRIHGISAAQVRQRKAELQLVKGSGQQHAQDLRQEIAAMAAGKAIR